MGIFDKRNNLFKRLSENVGKIRTVPRPDPESNMSFTNKQTSLPEFLRDNDKVDSSSLLNLNDLDEFRYLSKDREQLYKTFDLMMEDSIITAVVEMYADECCQYNEDGKIIWAESDDPEVSAYVNGLLEKLRIEENVWDHIYQLVYLGDVYLETFDNLTYKPHKRDFLTEPYRGNNNLLLQNRPEGLLKEEYIEQVPNPANIYDLTYRGKTVGFIKIPDEYLHEGVINYLKRANDEQDKLYIMEPTRYVHICLKNNKTRYPETFLLDYRDEDGNIQNLDLKVKQGKSILADIYKSYTELKLMKDSLLLNRINRSSRIRIMQVEVGDLPKNEKALMLKRLKDKVEQKNIMDKTTGKYASTVAPGPDDNIIYTTMTDGKGQVTMSDLGENLNVTGTADLQPFEDQFYGKLRISKGYLGADMEGSGLSNGGTLSQQDTVFARVIKRIQTAECDGIETLVNIFILNKLRYNDKKLNKYLGKFKIKMTSPSTTQDKERDESFKQKIDSIKQFMDLLGEDIIYPKTYKEILKKFTVEMLNKQEIGDLIDKDTFIEDTEKEESESYNDKPIFDDEPGGPPDDFQKNK